MRHPDYEFRARTYYGKKKKHRMKEKTPSMTKRTLLYESIDHTEELQETAPVLDKSKIRHRKPRKTSTYFRDAQRSWKSQTKAPRQWARHKTGITKKNLHDSVSPVISRKETYPDLYFAVFEERSCEHVNHDLESIYKYLFYDQIESATPDYEEFFVTEFTPDNVNWNDPDSAKTALIRLMDEIKEDRDDCDELFDAAGLTQTIKDSLYEVET